jgi:prefoldin alpha subunit
MNQQDIISMQNIDQEATYLNEQIQLIDQNISEFQELEVTLEELEKLESKEILANLGKRIFIPAEIKKKEIFVDVGSKTFVKKSLNETKDLLQVQLLKLIQSKKEISKRLDNLQGDLERLLEKVNKERK